MLWREDKILLMLGFFTVFFTAVTLVVVWARPDDGQTFTLFASTTTGFVGALLGWMRPPKKKVPPPDERGRPRQ